MAADLDCRSFVCFLAKVQRRNDGHLTFKSITRVQLVPYISFAVISFLFVCSSIIDYFCISFNLLRRCSSHLPRPQSECDTFTCIPPPQFDLVLPASSNPCISIDVTAPHDVTPHRFISTSRIVQRNRVLSFADVITARYCHLSRVLFCNRVTLSFHCPFVALTTSYILATQTTTVTILPLLIFLLHEVIHSAQQRFMSMMAHVC